MPTAALPRGHRPFPGGSCEDSFRGQTKSLPSWRATTALRTEASRSEARGARAAQEEIVNQWAISLDQPASYWQIWEWIQVSIPNLVFIIIMTLLFWGALLLPFPKGKDKS